MMEAGAGEVRLLEEAMGQGVWAGSRDWKRQGTDSPAEIPEASQSF